MISTLTGDSTSVIENIDTVSTIKTARLRCTDVYNVAHGQIVFIGAENGRAVVTVQCNPSEILRYGNLKELTCEKGYYAEIGAQLGTADKYVDFEYCTLWQGESNYPVRVKQFTYYKQDPTDILEGLYTVRKDGYQTQGYVQNINRVRFTEEQKAIFGDNILDINDEIKEGQVWSTKKSIKFLNSIGIAHRTKKQMKEDKENPEDPEDVGEG